MAQIGKENEELLTKNENKIASEVQPGMEEDEETRANSEKNKSSETKDYRKKKQDALEGRESKDAREDSEREDSGHHTADKAEAEDAGSHSRQGLQSGQTTVQFSSGGSMSASLTSLLGLFASSATLVRAEVGNVLNINNQSTNINLRAAFQASNIQAGILLGEEGKVLKGTVSVAAEQSSESTGYKFSVDTGSSNLSHSSSSAQDTLANLLKNISATGADNGGDLGSTTTVTVFSNGYGFTYIPGFNPNSFFFSKNIVFAFGESPLSTDTVLVGEQHIHLLQPIASNETIGVLYSPAIHTYLADAGLSTAGPYTYNVVAPIPTPPSPTSPLPSPLQGFTATPDSTNPVLSVDLTSLYTTVTAPKTHIQTVVTAPIDARTFGITLDNAGNLYTNVGAPMSILVDVTPLGGTTALPVRIDAGPGVFIDKVLSTALLTNVLVGTTTPGGQFTNFGSIFKVNEASANNGHLTITGNGLGLAIDQNSNVSYYGGLTGTGFFTLSSTTYSFPSSVIFRHVGDSLDTTPKEATYGNFGMLPPATPGGIFVPNIIHLPEVPSTYNLTFGGNVLDVFGTKYGDFDTLNVILPTGNSFFTSTAPNTLTFGGNTLAGYGLAYGDMQTLTITASPGSTLPLSPTNITFNGNLLWVDKNVNSTLFPHIQNLDMEFTTSPFAYSKMTGINLQFNDSIIHGNVGKNTFFGDVQNLGDANQTGRYNGFITGVKVSDDGFGHVVTKTADITTATLADQSNIISGGNQATWGNDIYTGGHDHNSSPDVADTYNFTLIGDMANEPVFLGHDVIKDFNPSTDVLVLQLTPDVFKTLDIGFNKTITAAGLDFGVMKQGDSINMDTTQTGTLINFNGGGSLKLDGVFINSFAQLSGGEDNTFISSPSQIPSGHLITEVNLTYVPVAPLVTAPPEPLLFGVGPNNVEGTYHNVLDNLFANTLLATYNVAPPANIAIDQWGSITVAATEPFFTPLTITASSINPDTLKVDTADSTFFMGFLKAPITTDFSGSPIFGTANKFHGNVLEGGAGSQIFGATQKNITFSSTIPGSPPTDVPGTGTPPLTIPGSGPPPTPIPGTGTPPITIPGAPLPGQTTFGTVSLGDSALISDTGGNATAYGTNQNITIVALGQNPDTTDPNKPVYPPSEPFDAVNHSGSQIITDSIFNTPVNAFYVNGTTYGIAQNLSIIAQGGNDSKVTLSSQILNGTDLSKATVDNTGQFTLNTFNFNKETLYGSGTLIGDMDKITIDVVGGVNNILTSNFNINLPLLSTQATASLDVSGYFTKNVFNFGPTVETVRGDTTSTQSILTGNLNELDVTTQSNFLKVVSPNFSVTSNAVFSDNHFIFSNDIFTGGNGITNFTGYIAHMGDPYGFANSTPTPYGYTGFVDGVTVTKDPNSGHIIVTDKSNNSISYGDNIYTGGANGNTYNFTIVEDKVGNAVMQGHNIINNFNPMTDIIVFHVESNLYKILHMDGIPLTDYTALSNQLGFKVTLTAGLIQFNGPNGADYGSLFLGGFNATGFEKNLSDIDGESSFFKPIHVVQEGTPYTPPQLVIPPPPFDPVFVDVTQPQAFFSFINGDFNALSWSVHGVTGVPEVLDPTISDYTAMPGVTLNSLGTLTVAPTGPVDAVVPLQVFDGVLYTPLNPLHLFAINATDNIIHRDTTPTVLGSTYSGTNTTFSLAFETSTPGNTIIGGGADISIDTSTSVTPVTYGSNLIYDVSTSAVLGVATGHTAIGDVANITFTNMGAHAGLDANNQPILIPLTGQNLTFNSNLFDVNAFDSNSKTNGAGIYGNAQTLTMQTAGGVVLFNPTTGLLLTVDGNITKNTLTFNSNTEYGSGNLYGSMNTLSLLILDPAHQETSENGQGVLFPVGNGFIQGNTFTFNQNFLTSQPVSTTLTGTATLYPGIGTLVMANDETALYPHVGVSEIGGPNPGDGTNPGDGNIFSFGDSILKTGLIRTTFNNDIADLSQTDFATQPVTVTLNNMHVQVMDHLHNTLNLGNDTFTGLSGTLSTYDITLLSKANGDPVGLGNITIQDYQSGDVLHFNLSPAVYRMLDTNFARVLVPSEFDALFGPTHTTLSQTLFSFVGGGSVYFPNYFALGFSFLPIVGSLIYHSELVTVHDANPQPLILSPIHISAGATPLGEYGLALDPYFDHLDISSIGTKYTVTDVYDSSFTTNPIGISFPQLALQSSDLMLSTDGFGTITAHTVTPLVPLLSPEVVTVVDVNNSTNHPQMTLMIGGFDTSSGTVLDDSHLVPDVTGVTTFTGSATEPSYLRGTASNEVMVGNLDPATGIANFNYQPSSGPYDPTNNVPGAIYTFNSSTDVYGGITYNTVNEFGGNLLTNLNPGTVAYGDFKNINVDILNNSANTAIEVNSLNMQFGQNVFDVNGTVYGVADNFILNVSQPSTDSLGKQIFFYQDKVNSPAFVFGNNTQIFTTHEGNYGNDTIYGQGTIYGVLNTLEVDEKNATINSGIFQFASTEIAITGDQPSTVFSNLDRLILSPQLNSAFISLGSTLTIGGSGGGNFYPDINDMSTTPFWTSSNVQVSNSAPFMALTNGFYNIDTGYHTVFLGGGNNIINVTLLDAGQQVFNSQTNMNDFVNTPVPEGALEIHNFVAGQDVIRFNMSLPLYDYMLSQGPITGTSLHDDFLSHSSVIGISSSLTDFQSAFGANRIITFDGSTTEGSIKLVGFNPKPTLNAFDDFAAQSIQLGTTFNGTALPQNVSAIESFSNFTFTVPNTITHGLVTTTTNDFTLFQEYDQITYFAQGPGGNTIQITLPQTLFDSSQSGILTSTAANSILATSQTEAASALTSTGGLTMSQSPAQFNPGGPTVDSTINFVTNNVTSGSIMVHNIDAAHLSDLGTELQLGQTGSPNGGSTFTYVIPDDVGHDLTSYTSFSYITNFLPSGVNPDKLQIILSPATYAKFSSDGTLNGTIGAAQLAAIPGIGGGILVSNDGTNTFLTFTQSGTNYGQIELMGDKLTKLSDLGSDLHVGYVEQGSPNGGNTFQFNIANPFSFTQYDHIANFNTTSPTPNNLQLTFSKAEYAALTLDTTLESPVTASNVGSNITVTNPAAQYNDANNVVFDTVLSFASGGAITLHNVDTNLTTLALGGQFETGYTQAGNGGTQPITFLLPASAITFGNYTEFNHVTNFDPKTDILQIGLPTAIYTTFSPDRGLDGTITTAVLEAGNHPAAGSITVTETPAQYTSANGVTVDSLINFTFNGTITGDIDLHNVDLTKNLIAQTTSANPDLSNLGSHLQIGSVQNGTASTADTFTFYIPDDGQAHFTSFTQFDHITNYDNSNTQNGDALQIVLPTSVYDILSSDHTLGGTVTAAALEANTSTSTGGIQVVEHSAQFGSGFDSILNFVANGNSTPSGSIDLHNIPFSSNDLGNLSHLQIGYIEQATTSNLTFSASTSSDLSSFKQFDHIVDFSNPADSLTIQISSTLNNTINNILHPGDPNHLPQPIPTGQSSNAELIAALDTGKADGISIGVQINAVEVPAQFNPALGAHDTVLQFLSNNVLSGSVTLHNVDLGGVGNAHITNLQHLLIAHP